MTSVALAPQPSPVRRLTAAIHRADRNLYETMRNAVRSLPGGRVEGEGPSAGATARFARSPANCAGLLVCAR